MNGKKIILITTLVASIILISLTMLFARFVLQIDFTGNDTQQTLENTSGETSSQPQEEDQQTEPSVDQPQSPQSEEENTQTEDENKAYKCGKCGLSVRHFHPSAECAGTRDVFAVSVVPQPVCAGAFDEQARRMCDDRAGCADDAHRGKEKCDIHFG